MLKKVWLIIFVIFMVLAGEISAISLNLPKLELNAPKSNITQPVITPTEIVMHKSLAAVIPPVEKTQEFLFVGDIMLDRNVEALMNKNGVEYPFEKIKDFLNSQNFVIANLEGPIVAQPKNFGDHAVQFAFASTADDLLQINHINLVSLANNHTLNMGQKGLLETRNYLQTDKISAIGDPLLCTQDFIYKKDNLIFLGLNKTFATSCPDDEIIKLISGIKKEEPDKFLIAFMHWGNEYKTVNSKTQQDLGHKMLDAGADLIIGSHPHVVQNIELYKNKLIFYSLGNFIFDQYFSKDVQQGLAISLEINNNKQNYNIYPIQSIKSQPSLMAGDDKSKFLADLAARSSKELGDKIKAGEIIINF